MLPHSCRCETSEPCANDHDVCAACGRFIERIVISDDGGAAGRLQYVTIRIRLSPGAQPPAYHSPGASGLDLRALGDHRLYDRLVVPTGLSMAIPCGFEGQIRPRSGLAAKGIVAVLGTIDSDYRGEIGVILLNLSGRPFGITAGDRIAQLVIAPVARAELMVSELDATERGAGGFGSTGER